MSLENQIEKNNRESHESTTVGLIMSDVGKGILHGVKSVGNTELKAWRSVQHDLKKVLDTVLLPPLYLSGSPTVGPKGEVPSLALQAKIEKKTQKEIEDGMTPVNREKLQKDLFDYNLEHSAYLAAGILFPPLARGLAEMPPSKPADVKEYDAASKRLDKQVLSRAEEAVEGPMSSQQKAALTKDTEEYDQKLRTYYEIGFLTEKRPQEPASLRTYDQAIARAAGV